MIFLKYIKKSKRHTLFKVINSKMFWNFYKMGKKLKYKIQQSAQHMFSQLSNFKILLKYLQN
jgi:NAD-dependent SIR2 family protein deacetylase